MKNIIQNAIYIVATPIGNLGDISSRAIEVLQAVDLIAVEDTRHSKQLLKHLGITNTMIALHEHNEREQAEELISKVQQGAKLALISDAGTPLISDPGYHLVRMALAAGVKVVPIPGASALICALSASGLPTDRFCFEGFLPAKAMARQQQLESLVQESRTLVFYESPHRILASLIAMREIFGADRAVTMARELTKQFETIFAGDFSQLVKFVESDSNQQRGEFVIMVAGVQRKDAHAGISDANLKVLKILLAELSIKQAASLAAEITGVSKNLLYDAALGLKS